MLTASDLALAHGSRTLFADVSLQLSAGRRIALVGGNGRGKTTLMEILVGHRDPDTGSVTRPRDLRLGYLPQELEVASHRTVLDEVLAGADHITELGRRVEELADALGSAADAATQERLLDEYGTAQSRFEQLGGFALESEAQQVISGLGFTDADSRRPVNEFSGGWRMRVALGRLLLSRPDVLLLDEPTNHLDVDSVAWLEQQLTDWEGALLFVSHDRDFIEGVATHVIELSGGQAYTYTGAFSTFVAQREERMAAQEAAAANQARRLAQTERFIERFRYKATKARQVQSRVKALDKIDRIAAPEREDVAARFTFPDPQRSSRVVVEMADASIGYDGEPVLRGVDLVVERGRKVALVGPNGAGKTTLVKALTGELHALTGRVTVGSNVDLAFFAQHQAEVLDPRRTVSMEFQTIVRPDEKRNPRTILGSFGFRGDAVDTLIADLSGGERTRLALAKVITNPVNLLVLDEPTNHLDLPSCDVLEDALQAYPGTVLLITHDRHLIRGVADALIEVRHGTARWHEGVDEAVLSPLGAAPRSGPEAEATPDPSPPPRPDKAAGRKARAAERAGRDRRLGPLKRKVAELEREWERAETAVADLQRRLAEPDAYADPDRARRLAGEHDEAKGRAAELMAAWEQAATELERIS